MLGLSKRVALIVLGIWLIATGLFAMAGIGFSGAGLVLNILAIVAGTLILLQGDDWSAKIGMILLGVWLLARGLIPLVGINVQGINLVLNVLAIAAGVLILLEE
jgi:hypothetical protein